MHIEEWYLPEDKTTKDALHYEILKYVNRKSISFFGKDIKDRFNNIGKIGPLKQEIHSRVHNDNPYWDIYTTVEYVRSTEKTSREEFRQQLEQGKSIEELATQYGTFESLIEKRKTQLENNQLGKDVIFTANFRDHFNKFTYDSCPFSLVFDIDGDDVIIHEENITNEDTPEQYKSPKEYVKNEYTRKEIIDAAYEKTQEITQFLDKQRAPYSVKFSGGRGFHIEIPREKLEDYITTTNYTETSQQFAEFIIDKTDVTEDCLDMSVYDSKSIFRVPYTMHTGSGLIAIPLTRQQFKNFELKYASPDYIRKNMSLRDRGLCTRTGKANKIIKQFNDWREEQDKEIQTDKREVRRNKQVKTLVQKINRLDDEQKQKLNKQVNW